MGKGQGQDQNVKLISIEIWQITYQIEGNYNDYNDYLIILKGYYMWCVLFQGIKQLMLTPNLALKSL